jgi:hypothetical protein
MFYTEDTTIAGASRGSAAAWHDWAREKGASRIGDVRQYLDTVYEIAPKIGLRAELIVTQSIHETSSSDGAVPWASHWWRERRNPAGIGITGDKTQNAASRDFGNGRDAALAHIVHAWLYAKGKSLPEGLSPDMDPRWTNAAIPAIAGKKTTIGAFGTADPRANPSWAADADYGKKWVRTLVRLESVIAAGGDVTPSDSPIDTGGQVLGDAVPRARPRILLRAGHRDASGGNAVEKELTDDMCLAYMAEGKRRGYDITWYNATLDQDNLPTSSVADLGGVAASMGAILAIWGTSGDLAMMLDLHYDGANSVIHAIPPGVESLGGGTLRSGFSFGAPSADTTANNTLDVKVGAAWAEHCRQATGYGVYIGTWQVPGIMRECETGVGRGGDRLGIMGGTARARKTCVRLVLEHGGTSQRFAQDFDLWARAAFDAFDEVFSVTGDNPNPPIDPPDPPQVVFARAEPPPWWRALMAEGATHVDLDDGVFFRTDAEYETAVTTARQADLVADDAVVGPPIEKGARFRAVAVGRVTDSGEEWVVTPWLTRVRLADLRFVGPASAVQQDTAIPAD